MDEVVVKMLIRFGWLYGMDVIVVKRYVQLYDEMGVHGEVFSLGVLDVVLLENGWIEQVNVDNKGKAVYRCVAIGDLISKFKVALDSFYKESNGFLKEIQGIYDVDSDSKFRANLRKDYLIERRKGKLLGGEY